MTTPEQPPYEANPTVSSYPAGQGTPVATGTPAVQTVRKGPGWGAYLVTVIALLVLVAVIVFVLQNNQPITVKFFSYKHSYKKSSVALGAAALAGFVAGLFLGLIPWMSARRQIRSLRRGVQV